MTKIEGYRFSVEVKDLAIDEAIENGVEGRLDVHHILPRWFADKYHLDPDVITSIDNAIALEADTLHPWIHGKHMCQYDDEVNWRGFDEADYIFLAVNLYGFDINIFDPKMMYRDNCKSSKKGKR